MPYYKPVEQSKVIGDPKVKTKKCFICKTTFLSNGEDHIVCSPECATTKNNEKFEKKKEQIKKKHWTKERAKFKKDSLTRGEWLKLYELSFNSFIRLRDKDLPCISCGVTKSNKWDAGHYYPTTYSFLRFNELNVHKQCSFNCNMNKRGNLHEYRVNLIKKIGLDYVKWLDENCHNKLDLSIIEIQEQIKIYKLKIKEIK